MPEENNIESCRLYGDLAWLWPIISPPSEYVKEVEEIADLLRQYSRREVQRVLNLGCGGGNVDHRLKRQFAIVGVDLSESMLALAKELNPEVAYVCGDLRDPPTDELFDAVYLSDAVNYMLSEDDLRLAFQAAYDHLAPGGVFLTVAEETRERFTAPRAYVSHHDAGRAHVTFVQDFHDPDTSDTTYELTLLFLIREGDKLTVEVDRHRGGLFPLSTWERVITEVGFEAEVTKLDTATATAIIGMKPLGRNV